MLLSDQIIFGTTSCLVLIDRPNKFFFSRSIWQSLQGMSTLATTQPGKPWSSSACHLVSLKRFEVFVILFLETWGLSARMTAWVSLIILVIICSHRHCRPHNYRCLSALTQRSAQMPMSAVFMSALVSLPEISVISEPTLFHDDLIKNSDRDVWQVGTPRSRNRPWTSFVSFVW